ncbi:HNH endonuclease [Lactococcus lactis]|uniref:HNH endonuclease n=1 Tax=Lactococcus lactis TaxID=1358 RepID=UPI0015D4A076|nr:HNH endonuclease [Lactococcus lactis]GFO78581.1 hypothetical protein LL1119B1_06370 [Lactococcus lactis]
MKCIFCKKENTHTKSVEHIIPESLGNYTFILPKGMVCDKCNHYFSIKIEKPFLEQDTIKKLRFTEGIPNKRGKIPPFPIIMPNANDAILKKRITSKGKLESHIFYIPKSNPEIPESKANFLIIPQYSQEIDFKNINQVAKFIAKIAVESLALRFSKTEESYNYFLNNPDFNSIINYVRFGTPQNWKVHIRRIYESSKKWSDERGENFQIVHESDFLFVDDQIKPKDDEYFYEELFFVVVLWGIEFAINMYGPKIDGYINWLKDNDYKSPLYTE